MCEILSHWKHLYLETAKRLLGRFSLMAISLGLSLVSSCSHTAIIKSDPSEATVTLLDEGGKEGVSLGKTPLETDQLPTGEVVVLQLEKDGHLPKVIVVPTISGGSVTVSTRLQPLTREFLAEKNRRDFAASLNENLVQILRLQSLILGKRRQEAAKLAEEMNTQWNDVSLFHSLMGNFHYLQGDFENAKKRYEKAIRLDPGNDEARTMLGNMR